MQLLPIDFKKMGPRFAAVFMIGYVRQMYPRETNREIYDRIVRARSTERESDPEMKAFADAIEIELRAELLPH